MDFGKGLFTLHVKEGTTISPGEIREVVRARFKIPRVEVVGLSGKVKKSTAAVHFAATGQKSPYLLTDAKGKKTVVELADGATVRVSGVLVEKKLGEKKQLVIEVGAIDKGKASKL